MICLCVQDKRARREERELEAAERRARYEELAEVRKERAAAEKEADVAEVITCPCMCMPVCKLCWVDSSLCTHMCVCVPCTRACRD